MRGTDPHRVRHPLRPPRRRPSRTCAARAGSPTPTSTPRPARSGSRCSRPTSRCPSCKEFIAAVRERARSEEVSQALNPAQQIIKIVDEELVTILGGETRRLRFAKTPPTVIMLAGLQGSGKTTLAGKLALLAQGPGPARRCSSRPTSSDPTPSPSCRSSVSAPASRSSPPSRATASATRSTSRARSIEDADAQAVRRRHRRHRRPPRRRRRPHAAGRRHPRRGRSPTRCSSSSTR